MRLCWMLLASQYRLRLWPEIKRLVFAVGLVAAVFFLVAMWPAFEAGHRSTYQHARYDIMVNGPLNSPDLTAIDRVLGREKRAQVRMVLGYADRIDVVGSRRATKANVFRYEPADQTGLPLTYFNDGVLLQGSMRSPRAWGIDYASARTLGVGIGDRVRFTQRFSFTDESEVSVTRAGTIRAIFQPSTVLSGLVVPLTTEDRPLFRGVGMDLTHVYYVVRGDPERTANQLRRLPPAANWLVETLAAQRRGAENAIDMGAGDTRSLTSGILVAGAVAYAVYSLLDEQRRFSHRSRSLAIASSLGAGWRTQLTGLVFEQALFAVVSCGLGAWLGSQLLWHVLRSYIPAHTYLTAALWALAANLLVVVATSGVVVWRLARLPAVRLLTSE